MHARQPLPEALLRLARLQAGVVSREQVLGTGFGAAGLNRLVRSGTWVRVSSGIYLTATVPVSWPAFAWSGVLVGGDAARLGGLAAAHLHDLVPKPPDQIEVLVPAGRAAPAVSGPWYFRRERIGVRSRTSLGSPPRLPVEDTVLDLIDHPHCATRDAVNWLTMAVQARKTTPQRILRAALFGRAPDCAPTIGGTMSETRLSFREERRRRRVRAQSERRGASQSARQAGQRHSEVDVYYEEFGLLVELDGRLGHTGMGRFRDMRRDNAATTDGLATLRYGKADVFGIPCEVASEVTANLVRLGWQGVPRRCDRCRRAA